MEQNLINNAYTPFENVVSKRPVTDENQMENLYNLVNQSDTAFKLAKGMMRRHKINLDSLLEKLKPVLQQSSSVENDENKEILIIISIILLNNKMVIAANNNSSSLEKDLFALFSYIETNEVPLFLLVEASQLSEISIYEALKPAILDSLIYWNEQTQSYTLDSKLKLAYWVISKEIDKKFPIYLLNLLKFYIAKLAKNSIDTKQKIDNIINYAASTIIKIQATDFQFSKEFILIFVDLIDKIGSYEMEIKKNGERALQYFELALKNLASYKGEVSDDFYQNHIKILAKSITANIAIAQDYLQHRQPHLAIKKYQELASVVENFYKNKPFEIAKFLFCQATAYAMAGQLDKRKEICNSIIDLINPYISHLNSQYIIHAYEFAKTFFIMDEFAKSLKLSTYALNILEKNSEQNSSSSDLNMLTHLQNMIEICNQRINKLDNVAQSSPNFFSKESSSSVPQPNEKTSLIKPNSPKKSLCCCIL